MYETIIPSMWGRDYPWKLYVLENLGSLEFPTDESQVCVKNTQEVP